MRPIHVLIVDDQRDARSVLRAGLETLKNRLVITDVPSGEEAILVIATQPIDLLIADVRLPGISGLELQERARLRNPEIKIILITGLTDSRIRNEIANAGAFAFFFKPVEMNSFLSTVERCLGFRTEIEGIVENENLEAAPALGVSERLAVLRQDMKASCAILISENGEIVAQAGNLPEDVDEIRLVHAVLITLDVANKFSHAVGAAQPEDLMIFSGGAYDLALAHLGQRMGLLLMATGGWGSGERVKNLVDGMRLAVKDLLGSLSEIGVPVFSPISQPPLSEPIETEVETDNVEPLPDLDVLFKQAETLEKATADTFWDTAAAENNKEAAGADTISFEQARQLGLSPEED